MISRSLRGLVLGLVGLLIPAGVAFADPAGPTDYRSEVVSVTPETPAVDIEILGVDAFVQLTVDRGTEVIVIGYYEEPYLRIRADGTVEENTNSPTGAQNESRYGTPPAEANVGTTSEIAERLPQWERIGSGGTYAWHDHRSHWMLESKPNGKHGGDIVVDDVIPLEVDGTPVDVRVISVLQSAPSRLPVFGGAIIGLFGVLILWSTRNRIAWLLVPVAAAAGAIGWWQFNSLPASTQPSATWYLLPAIAAGSAIIALPFGRSLISSGLVMLAAIELGTWCYLRREGLVRALIPSDAPGWLDRGVTAGAAVVAVLAVLASGLYLLRGPTLAADATPVAPRRPRPSPKSVGDGVKTWGRSKP